MKTNGQKSKVYFEHTRKRAKQRYGVELDEKLYKNWINIIRPGAADLIRDQKDPNNPSFKDSLYKLYYRDKTIIALYSHAYCVIKTVFEDNPKRYRKRVLTYP
jgi:hypothetical protein